MRSKSRRLRNDPRWISKQDMTLTGGLINDASRALEGDGEAVGSHAGTYVGPAATNLLTAPGDFSNAAWQVAGGTSAKTSTTEPDPGGGTTGCLFTVAGANGYLWQRHAVSASTAYVFSFWAKRGTHASPNYYVYDVTNAAYIVAETNMQSLINTTSLTRVTVSFTTPIGCVSIDTGWMGNDGGNFTVAWPQNETGSIATPYTLTTRAAGRVQMPSTGMSATAFGVIAKFRANHASANVVNFDTPLVWYTNNNERAFHLFYRTTSTRWELDRRTGGVTAPAIVTDTFSAGALKTMLMTGSATAIGLAVDGGAISSTANTSIPASPTALVDVGSWAGVNQFGHNVLWLALYGSGGQFLGNGDSIAVNALPASLSVLSRLPKRPLKFWDGVKNLYRVRVA